MNYLELPKNVFDIFAILSFIATSIFFVFSQIRRNDVQVLRESNNDLRLSIDDKSKKIDLLEKEIGDLKLRFDILEAKNNDLANLVKQALISYFQANPSLAKETANKV